MFPNMFGSLKEYTDYLTTQSAGGTFGQPTVKKPEATTIPFGQTKTEENKPTTSDSPNKTFLFLKSAQNAADAPAPTGNTSVFANKTTQLNPVSEKTAQETKKDDSNKGGIFDRIHSKIEAAKGDIAERVKQDITEIKSFNAEIKDKVKTATDKIDGKLNADKSSKTHHKNLTPEEKELKNKRRETMNGFFSRYYTGWDKFSPEQKIKHAKQYFKSLANNPAKQAAEFKRLYESGATKEEITVIANVIDRMDKRNQLKSVKMVCNNGTEEQKDAGGQVVSDNIQNYDKTVQTEATKVIVETGDQKLMTKVASHVCEFDESNQVGVTEILVEKGGVEAQKTIALNYGKYEEKNEIGMHTAISKSKHSEVVELAAANIWKLHKPNHAGAVKITASTKNEKAITAAAANYEKYDTSADVRSEIRSIIYATEYSSAKAALQQSAQNEISNYSKPATSSSTTSSPSTTSSYGTSTSSSTTSRGTDTESFKNAELSGKIEILTAIGNSNDKDKTRELFQNTSDSEKIALLHKLPPSMLGTAINAILADNPSGAVLAEIRNLIGDAKDADKQGLIENLLNNNASSKLFTSQIGTLDCASQRILIKKMAENGELKSIDKKTLTEDAKDLYEELEKENKSEK